VTTIPSQPPIDAVYIGLELMDTDLQNVLSQQQLSSDYAQLFSYQLLRGLKVIMNYLVVLVFFLCESRITIISTLIV